MAEPMEILAGGSMRAVGRRGTFPYRITPLDEDGTRGGIPPIVGHGDIELATEYDGTPGAPVPVSLALSLNGVDAREWGMDDFEFECWPPVTGITCDEYDGPETWGHIRAPHLRARTLDDGSKIIEVIPVNGVNYIIGTASEPHQD